jgi:hypothetical protein
MKLMLTRNDLHVNHQAFRGVVELKNHCPRLQGGKWGACTRIIQHHAQ